MLYLQTSTQLLKELSAFLSTFQHDLSAVSGHISELQGRSKTIEARLEARKVRAGSKVIQDHPVDLNPFPRRLSAPYTLSSRPSPSRLL